MNIKWTYADGRAVGYEYWSMHINGNIDHKAVIYHNNTWRMEHYNEPEWEVRCDFIPDRTLPAPITNGEEAMRYVEALYRLEGV